MSAEVIQPRISAETQALLGRITAGQVRFSDVFPEIAPPEGGNQLEERPWQRFDFDAALTDEVESSGFPKAAQVSIGFRPWLANYGLVLVDDLVRSRDERVALKAGDHPDFKRERQASEQAIIALANYAPRDEANTADDHNGSDFYLAITDAGLEVYVTPLNFLSSLDARNRITSLYRIPTKDHPEFNGDHEQFRSARVVRSRRHPEHLVPIFEYSDRAELLAAKGSANHPDAIPTDQRTGHIAYVDKFGNVKLELSDAAIIRSLAIGRTAILNIRNQGREYNIRVSKAEDLASAPSGELAVYENCSDPLDDNSGAGFIELASRVEDNPSTSEHTAIFQILKLVEDLDIAVAEVNLRS